MERDDMPQKEKKKSWFLTAKKKMFGEKKNERITEPTVLPVAAAVLDEAIPDDVLSTWSFGSGSDHDDTSSRRRTRKKTSDTSLSNLSETKKSVIESLYSMKSSGSQEGIESTAELGDIFKLVTRIPLVDEQQLSSDGTTSSNNLPPDSAELAFNSRMNRMMKTIADHKAQDISRRLSVQSDHSSGPGISPARRKSMDISESHLSPVGKSSHQEHTSPACASVLVPNREISICSASATSTSPPHLHSTSSMIVEHSTSLSTDTRTDDSISPLQDSQLSHKPLMWQASDDISISSVSVQRSLSFSESCCQTPSLQMERPRLHVRTPSRESATRGTRQHSTEIQVCGILRHDSDDHSLRVNRSLNVSFAPEIVSFENDTLNDKAKAYQEKPESVEAEIERVEQSDGQLNLRQFDDLLKVYPHAGKLLGVAMLVGRRKQCPEVFSRIDDTSSETIDIVKVIRYLDGLAKDGVIVLNTLDHRKQMNQRFENSHNTPNASDRSSGRVSHLCSTISTEAVNIRVKTNKKPRSAASRPIPNSTSNQKRNDDWHVNAEKERLGEVESKWDMREAVLMMMAPDRPIAEVKREVRLAKALEDDTLITSTVRALTHPHPTAALPTGRRSDDDSRCEKEEFSDAAVCRGGGVGIIIPGSRVLATVSDVHAMQLEYDDRPHARDLDMTSDEETELCGYLMRIDSAAPIKSTPSPNLLRHAQTTISPMSCVLEQTADDSERASLLFYSSEPHAISETNEVQLSSLAENPRFSKYSSEIASLEAPHPHAHQLRYDHNVITIMRENELRRKVAALTEKNSPRPVELADEFADALSREVSEALALWTTIGE